MVECSMLIFRVVWIHAQVSSPASTEARQSGSREGKGGGHRSHSHQKAEQRILALFGWWFQIFFIFIPVWGRFPFWLIFFKGVETTNQWIVLMVWEIQRENHLSGCINCHRWLKNNGGKSTPTTSTGAVMMFQRVPQAVIGFLSIHSCTSLDSYGSVEKLGTGGSSWVQKSIFQKCPTKIPHGTWKWWFPKGISFYQGLIFRFHVKLQGCSLPKFNSSPLKKFPSQ